jgi:hypothetical protein
MKLRGTERDDREDFESLRFGVRFTMDDNSHLDSFAEQQSDPICQQLIQRFIAICRDPNVGEAEYSTRIRETMEDLLEETDAPTESVSG